MLAACICDTYIFCWLKYLLINQILLKLKYGVDKYLLLPTQQKGKHVLDALIQSFCLHGNSNMPYNFKVRTISFIKVYLRLLHFQNLFLEDVKIDRNRVRFISSMELLVKGYI